MYASDETRGKLLNEAMASVERCAELVIEYCDGKERKKQLNKLAGLMEKCCLLENNYHITKASLSESQKILKQHNHDSEESDRLEMSFREVFNQQVEEKFANATSPKKHKKYVAFIKNNQLCLQAKVDDSDDELAVADSDMLTLDPITKQTMTDPVRIKQCGHTFERSSIVSLLKNKRHIRCPLPGCVQSHVAVSDLEEHSELKLQLNQALQATGTDHI